MQKIKNIFLELPGYNCFGCGPANNHGLKLEFFLDEEKNEAVSYYQPEEHLVGFPGILHGGIQATLMDEIAFWVMFGLYKKMGFTTKMEIQFKRALNMANKVELRGKIVEKNDKSVKIKCWLSNSQKQICTEAIVEYVIVSKKLWIRNMGIADVPNSFKEYFHEM
ncbi:MAG: PaaI family thioesterase [Calditrichia bacterium]|nr:PaaI family thioesterase [Calditrichia bacterium]